MLVHFDIYTDNVSIINRVLGIGGNIFEPSVCVDKKLPLVKKLMSKSPKAMRGVLAGFQDCLKLWSHLV